MINLEGLTPAAEEGWWLLFDLAEIDTTSWVLIGGQLMHLLAAEHGSLESARPTDDLDIVVNVRVRRGGIEWVARWLRDRDLEFEGANPDGIGHRFSRPAAAGRGRTIIDLLAPEGLGERTNIYTIRPARTVQVPGSVQAINRAEIVEVTVSGMVAREPRTGLVPRPNLLGALVAKAAATTIAVRDNPERDWQDAALLLATIVDPIATAAECDGKDRRRLRRLRPLAERDHVGWDALGDEAHLRGATALAFLLGD